MELEKSTTEINQNSVSKLEKDVSNNDIKKAINDDIEFYSGDDLDYKTASEITKSTETRIIVLAGEQESGKTTILCCLNDSFQKNTFSGFHFAGSKTLLSFESRSFDSRLNSGREGPHTIRTQSNLDDIKFLHFVVQKDFKNYKKKHLLFTDISGENFELAMNSSEDCKKLWILKQADHFSLLFDGAKIINDETKHQAKAFGMTLLRRLVEEKMICPNVYISILFSKYDLIVGNKNKTKIDNFIQNIKDEISNIYKPIFKRIAFHNISSRSMNKLVDEGYGLKDLFPKWVSGKREYQINKKSGLNILHFEREFLKFNYQ